MRVIDLRSFLATVVLLFAFLSASALQAQALPRTTPENVGLSSDRLERLPAAMQRYIDANQLAGTVTLVARNGKIAHLESRG